MRKFLLIISFMFIGISSAQQTITTGNLLRINFTKPVIDLSDTLWRWTTYSSKELNIYNNCANAFSLGTIDYLITFKGEYDRTREWRYNFIYNNSTKSNRQIISIPQWLDPMDPYLYTKPVVEKVNNGAWIFFGIQRTALFVRNDSLYEGITDNNLKMIHLIGKIGNKHLLVLEGDKRYTFYFYLADLSNSPKIQLEKVIEMQVNGVPTIISPYKIHHLSDSLFFHKEELCGCLYLMSISNNKMNLLKRVKPDTDYITIPDLTFWFFNKSLVFNLFKSKLYKETFNLNTQSFGNKDSVLNLQGLNYTLDVDSNYIAYYKNDSLFVYSINKEKYVFIKSLKTINGLSLELISAPYVYFRQTQSVKTDVKQDKLPNNFSLDQNYPNPFNPSTVISYQLAVSSFVTLKVYDVLGREIATLVNEFQQAGKFVKTFPALRSGRHGISLPTGVYFYTLRAGDYLETKKMVYLK